MVATMGINRSSTPAGRVITWSATWETSLCSSWPVSYTHLDVYKRQVHGESGLGPVQLPRAGRPFDDKKAWDVLYEEAVKAEGKLQVIAIGPLTNIATALLLYPELKKSIAHLTIMGGSAKYGNSSPYGEFNIWVDPYAAKLVMESGIPITLLGLDTLSLIHI